MKKKLIIITLGLLLLGVNAYADGDLQVNGSIGIGTVPPTSYKSEVSTITTRGLKVTATMDQDGVMIGDSVFGALLKSEITGTATGTAGGISLLSVCSSNASNVNMVAGSGMVVSYGSDTAGTTTVDRSMGSGFDVLLNPGNRDYIVTNGYGNNIILRDNRYSGNGTLHINDFRNLNINAPTNDYGAISVDALSGIWLDKQTLGGTSNYGIVLNGDGAGADVVFGASQESRIYSSGGRLYASDSAGNQTIISPHDPETGEWVFYSKNVKTGKTVRVDMEKLVKAVEKLTGETFMIETIIE